MLRQPTSAISEPPTKGTAINGDWPAAISHGTPALLPAVGAIEQRARIGDEIAAEQPALDHPGADQHRRRWRQCAGQRSRRKERKAGHEDAFGAQPIADRSCRENERGKCNRVGAHNPLQLRHAAAKGGANTVQRGVDDRDIELHDPVTKTHCRER